MTQITNLLPSLPPPPMVAVVQEKKKKTEELPFGMREEHSKSGVKQFDKSDINLSNAITIINDGFSDEVELVPKLLKQKKADTNSKYPDRFDAACFYCAHKFKGKPIGVPVAHNASLNVFRLRGFFCSYNCALAYAFERESPRIASPASSLLVLLRKRIDGVPSSVPLRKAKHWSTLRLFGGPLTITQFRKQSNDFRLKVIPEDVHLIPFGFNVFKLQRIACYKDKKVRMRRSSAGPPKRPCVRRRKTVRSMEKATRKLKIVRYGSINIRSLKDVLKKKKK